MAYIPARLRMQFTSFDGSEHCLLVCDTDWGGFVTDFKPDGDGYQIEYGSKTDNPWTSLKPSQLTVNFFVEDDNESAYELFATDLITSQESEFFVKVLKGQNTSGIPGDIWDEFYHAAYDNGYTVEKNCNGMDYEWRGQVVQDLYETQDLPNPLGVSLQANCGLAKLKELQYVGEFQSILLTINDILSNLGGDMWSDNEPYIRTAVRWFETQMWSGSSAGIDPIAWSRFRMLGVFFEIKENGETDYFDVYDSLEKVLGTWNCQMFMANGRWNIIQTDQYDNTETTYFEYARNYTASDPSSPTDGELTVDGTMSLQIEADNDVVDKTAPNQLTGSTIKRLPALREAFLTFDFTTSPEIYRQTFVDTTSTVTIGSILSGTGLSLGIELYHREWIDTITINVAENVVFTSAFEIKITNGGTVYYLVNTNGKLVWQTTAGVYKFSSAPVFIYDADGSITEYGTKFVTPTIPQQGTLTIELDATVIKGKSSGDTYTPTYNDQNTDITVEYYDQTEEIAGQITYFASNGNFPNSSAVADLGEAFIGDYTISPFKNKIQVYDGADWLDSVSWQREAAGTTYPINQLRCVEVVQAQNGVVRRYQGKFIFGNVRFFNALVWQTYVYKFIGGTYKAKMETWDATWIEVGRSSSGLATDLDRDNTNDDRIPVGGQAVDPDNTIGAGIGDRFKISGTSSDDTSGTVTSLSIAALPSGTKTIRKGDVIRLTDPTTGNSEELTVDADSSAGATSISVSSTSLTYAYPKGSLISFDGNKLMQKVGAPDTEAIDNTGGTLTDSNGSYTLIDSVTSPIDGYYRLSVAIQLATESADNILIRLHDGSSYIYFESDFEITGAASGTYPLAFVTGTIYLDASDQINLEYANDVDWTYDFYAINLIKVF